MGGQGGYGVRCTLIEGAKIESTRKEKNQCRSFKNRYLTCGYNPLGRDEGAEAEVPLSPAGTGSPPPSRLRMDRAEWEDSGGWLVSPPCPKRVRWQRGEKAWTWDGGWGQKIEEYSKKNGR
jgi:hypothetical protein